MMTLVPVTKDEYNYCAVFPGLRSDVWPTFFGSELAVPLEVNPAWEIRPEHAWLENDEQDWPSDVARNCSRLGYEVSSTGGVPLIGRELLQAHGSYFWDHLTLGLVSKKDDIGDRSGWAWLRQELLMSLIPDSWLAPALGSGESVWQGLQEITRWLLKEGRVRGAQVSKLTFQRSLRA